MPSACPTISLPARQSAIVAQGPGKLAIQHDVPMPPLGPDMVIVKTAAVAINPVDAKMLDYSAAPGAVLGHDFSGTVVAIGSDVQATKHLAVGDRVAGVVHGMNKLKPDIGAFAEYVGAYADILLKIPDTMSFEEAASFGTGVATAMMGLFQELALPIESLEMLHDHHSQSIVDGPAEKDGRKFVLVAGGSTATGTRAIQLLKLAGFRPIASCSRSNFDLARRFGAEEVFDYRSPTCATDIRAYTSNELGYALDCVTQADTTQLCYTAMGRAGGRYVSLEPFRENIAQSRSLTIQPSWLMMLTIFGHKVPLDGVYGREARPKDREFGARAFTAVQGLLDRGLIDAHPIKVQSGSWQGVMRGVEIIRNQAVSGQKLVYTVV
ncbi:zinc-binding alcohol dehydrogenase family protein [Aspergillus ibericus CBS 121593]|uniref:GroES-like protein n=1 Tax=Aspergillus ibericus CBS 121593 TaxID=1448316 RepID=A0A395GS84_9EURO|nr:GroES-like protein [Aspergillus ibericus CBS 121593]RAK98440.1 GroES-like protein [Aspergillus ibericus CBS 121593]